MSRKSLGSRMDRIMDALLPRGSFARRQYDLPDHLRAVLAEWREETASIIARLENQFGPGWFRLVLADEIAPPPMPRVLSDALGLVDPPTLTVDMTTAECAEAYHQFAQGEG